MKTIIAATDFSSAAFNALNYAAQMALAIHANLLLFHTYQIPVGYVEVPFALDMEGIKDDAEKNINSLKEELTRKTNGKLSIETKVEEGSVFEQLKDLCKQIKPYAVVMGSQGTTAAERFFFGSESVYTAKHLDWPVITVPPDAGFTTVKKIGFACDFDNVVTTIPIEEIKMLVKDFNAELHILNTGEQKTFSPELVFESGLLQEMVIDVNPNYHFITNKNIDEGIMDFAEKNNIDLLLVLPKHHFLPEQIVFKSHTRQFILHSHVPVMALHQ